MSNFFLRLDSYQEIVLSPDIVLTGTRSSSVVSVEVNGIALPASSLSPGAWRADLSLAVGQNTITAQGFSIFNDPTELITINIVLEKVSVVPDVFSNTLDRWGQLLSLERLPGEPQFAYRYRLLDIFVNKPDATSKGLISAASRELGVPVTEDVLSIEVNFDPNGTPLATNATIELYPSLLSISCEELLREDTLQVKPGTGRVILTKVPRNPKEISVVPILSNLQVDPRAIEFLEDTNELVIKNEDLFRQWLVVKYKYVEEISLADITLQDLIDAVNAIEDGGNQQLFSATTTEPTLDADGLFSFGGLLLDSENEAFESHHSGVRIRQLVDPLFMEANLDDEGSYLDTRIEAWSKLANIKNRVIWKVAELDVDFWDSGVSEWFRFFLRGLWDTRVVKAYPSDSKLTAGGMQAFVYGGGYNQTKTSPTVLIGYKFIDFRSGVGSGAPSLPSDRDYLTKGAWDSFDLALTIVEIEE